MSIRNTEKEAKDNPLFALFTAQPGGIEAQEARGQRELVESTQLPKDTGFTPRSKFEELGIRFGAEIPDDPLFIDAELPDGWTRRASDHSMWSYLVDQFGRDRCSIFYKAAFYDRRATINLVARLGFTMRESDEHWIVVDNATKQVVLDGGPAAKNYMDPDAAYDACRQYLQEHRAIEDEPWPDPA